MLKYLVLLALFFHSSIYAISSDAANFCDAFFKVYASGCDNRTASNVAGGSFPLLFDAFNLSPANLPTYLTPTGIEYFKGVAESNFALIKGFKNLGLGALSRATHNTFMSEVENYEIALKNHVANYTSTMTDAFRNIGFDFNLINRPGSIVVPVGASYKYNPEKQIGSLIYGVSARTSYLNFSYSYNKEEPNPYTSNQYNLTERIKTQMLSAGFKYRTLMVDYAVSQVDHDSQYNVNTGYSYYSTDGSYKVRTTIISGTWKLGNLNLTYARREQDDSRFDNLSQSYLQSIEYEKVHHMYGARYSIGNFFNLGVYHNYVIEEDFSILAQLLL